ncbi:MAG: hypothetical protein NZ765_06495, partial [Anaerolineae bacterium]|nr:hypothetical protein [Anaerolineae bacterium]MDW8071699.1 hypothetical protein [Anaerolineae bacterium]
MHSRRWVIVSSTAILLSGLAIIILALEGVLAPGDMHAPPQFVSTSLPTTAAVSSSTPTGTTPADTPVSLVTPPFPSPTTTPDVGRFGRPYPDAPLPLSAFPRPPQDNGLGVHWSTHLHAQSAEATSYFVSELARMNIRWVKLLNDGTRGRAYDHTIEELVARGIMPVLRLYQRCNEPFDPEDLTALVRHYVAKGVYYYELYNEPNLPGKAGGWCQKDGKPQPEYLARIWADAARVIYRAGGYPSLPSFFAPSKKRPDWRRDFFYQFFDALRAQGNTEVLYFSWAPIHNYNINHPPDYPYDEVNLTSRPLTQAEIERYTLTPEQVAKINHARATAREPG